MTDAYECDRCGEFKTGELAYLRFDIHGRPMHRDYPSKPDLCKDCEDDFAEFMDGEPA